MVGIHRFQLKRTSGDADALGQLTNALHDSIFAHGTIMLAINDDLRRVLVFRLQQPVQQKLNRFEHFSVTTDQAPALLGVNLESKIFAFALHLRDFDHETEVTEHGIE